VQQGFGHSFPTEPERLPLAGSHPGGEKAASIYPIVQTIKLDGADFEVYLRDTLT
jgi:hypothetical protein